MSGGVGCRCSSGPMLLWLWHRRVAIALIRPLAWEPPYAAGMALEKETEQNKTKKTLKRQKNKNKKKTVLPLVFLYEFPCVPMQDFVRV